LKLVFKYVAHTNQACLLGCHRPGRRRSCRLRCSQTSVSAFHLADLRRLGQLTLFSVRNAPSSDATLATASARTSCTSSAAASPAVNNAYGAASYGQAGQPGQTATVPSSATLVAASGVSPTAKSDGAYSVQSATTMTATYGPGGVLPTPSGSVGAASVAVSSVAAQSLESVSNPP
jgi:hypothetical protein